MGHRGTRKSEVGLGGPKGVLEFSDGRHGGLCLTPKHRKNPTCYAKKNFVAVVTLGWANQREDFSMAVR